MSTFEFQEILPIGKDETTYRLAESDDDLIEITKSPMPPPHVYWGDRGWMWWAESWTRNAFEYTERQLLLCHGNHLASTFSGNTEFGTNFV